MLLTYWLVHGMADLEEVDYFIHCHLVIILLLLDKHVSMFREKVLKMIKWCFFLPIVKSKSVLRLSYNLKRTLKQALKAFRVILSGFLRALCSYKKHPLQQQHVCWKGLNSCISSWWWQTTHCSRRCLLFDFYVPHKPLSSTLTGGRFRIGQSVCKDASFLCPNTFLPIFGQIQMDIKAQSIWFLLFHRWCRLGMVETFVTVGSLTRGSLSRTIMDLKFQ